MRRSRRNPNAAVEARVALEDIRGETAVAEIAADHQLHPNRVTGPHGAIEVSCRASRDSSTPCSSRLERRRLRRANTD